MTVKPSQKSQAICSTCSSIVSTTFYYRNIVFNGIDKPLRLLAGVCDTCDNVVSLPAQTEPEVNAFLKRVGETKMSRVD